MTTIIFSGKSKTGATASLMYKFINNLDRKSGPVNIIYCASIKANDKAFLLKSRNIIIFTPTYWFGIPSRLQKLIEQLTSEEEKKYNFLAAKRFACVAYSPHGGDTECITKLGLIFNSWGCEIIPCGLIYFRSVKKFDKDHWSLDDLKSIADRII